MRQPGVILLAEDNSDDVLILRRVLKKARVAETLTVVNDGQQAIDYLAGHGPYQDRQAYPLPCLILLDLKMPRKSGFDVLEWLSQNEVLSAIPAVVLSSSGEARDIDRAIRLGAKAYLCKPPDQEKLSELVKTACSSEPVATER
jgi:CheY-like chemotaxis protein